MDRTPPVTSLLLQPLSAAAIVFILVDTSGRGSSPRRLHHR
jgi:hypothetical protein